MDKDMRKNSLALISTLFIVTFIFISGCASNSYDVNNVSVDSPFTCKQTYKFVVREGDSRTFGLVLNGGNHRIKIKNVDWFSSGDQKAIPDFKYTELIRQRNGVIQPNESIKILIAESIYEFSRPPFRKENNLLIGKSYVLENMATGEEMYHSDCALYEVTSCGDGIVDKEYEECDPQDPKKEGWRNGCDSNCKPII